MDKLLDQVTEEYADIDRIEAVLAALNEVDPLPDPEAFDAQQGLRRFHERLAAREAAKDESAARRSMPSRLHHSVHRFARFVLIAATCALITAGISVQAFRWNFFEVFVHWTSELLHFNEESVPHAHSTKNPLKKGEERVYASVQEMLDDFGIADPLCPAWIPERFTELEIKASYTALGLHLYGDYISANEYLTIKASEVAQDNSWDTVKNSSEADVMPIHGVSYYLLSSEAGEKSVWQNGTFECRVYGSVTREEMERIVSSISEGR